APMSDAMLALHCALAQQAFRSEYAYAQSPAELDALAKLRAVLASKLQSRAPIDPSIIAALASYASLDTLPEADALLGQSWPAPLRAVIDQQIRSPRAVRSVAETIPQFTPVDDAISKRVAQMYGQNPYPRWDKFPPPERQIDIAVHLRAQFPHAPIRFTS